MSKNTTVTSSRNSRLPRFNKSEHEEHDINKEHHHKEHHHKEQHDHKEHHHKEYKNEKQDRLKPHEPSICIPRAHETIHGKNIREVVREKFISLRIGRIDRIDAVYKKNSRGEKFCTIYIHMHFWNTKIETARNFRDLLIQGKEVKIVYDEPWFWKCTASTLPKPDDRRPAARIVFDEEEQNSNERSISPVRNRKSNISHSRSISPERS